MEKARDWYEQNGVSNEDWESFDRHTRRMISIEVVCDGWDEVVGMREAGIPESSVLLHVHPEMAGVDRDEVEYHSENQSDYESLSPFVMQNASRNIASLFKNSAVTVLSVSYDGDNLIIEVEPN